MSLYFFFLLWLHLASLIYIDCWISPDLRNFQSLFLKIFFSAPFSPSLLQSGILSGLDNSAHFLPNHFSLHYLYWVISMVSSSLILLPSSIWFYIHLAYFSCYIFGLFVSRTYIMLWIPVFLSFKIAFSFMSLTILKIIDLNLWLIILISGSSQRCFLLTAFFFLILVVFSCFFTCLVIFLLHARYRDILRSLDFTSIKEWWLLFWYSVYLLVVLLYTVESWF